MSYTGRCACGAVTATITAEPVTSRQCWCAQCQKVAAGSPTSNAMFPVEAITIEGTLSTHDYVAASGNTLTHSFCGQCGTPVMAQTTARPQFRTIRLGFLDAGHGIAPVAAIWLDDAPGWAHLDPALDHFPQQPPPPPTK